MTTSPHLHRDGPAYYQILVQGALDANWFDSFQGMKATVAHSPDGEAVTTLTGELVDQAALIGALNLLYDLGLAVLSVECLQQTEN